MQTFPGYQLDQSSGFYFPDSMPEGARRAIAAAYRDGHAIRLFFGDIATGKAWPEEHDVKGTVGRSMGPCKVPLLLRTTRSSGGGAISGAVVAVQTARGFAWQAPGFTPGEWRSARDDENGRYPFAAYCDGQLHARFDSLDKAARYCEFMAGERFGK